MQIYGKVKKLPLYFKSIIKFYELKNEAMTPVIFVLILAVLLGTQLWGTHFVKNNMNDTQFLLSETNKIIQEIQSYPGDPSLITEFVENNMGLFVDFYKKALKFMVIIWMGQVIAFFLYKFYMTAYYTDLRTSGSTATMIMKLYVQRLPKLVGFNLIYFLGMALILILLAIPILLIVSLLVILFTLLLKNLGLILIINVLGFAAIFLYLFVYVSFIFKDLCIIDRNTGVLQTLKDAWKMTKGQKRVVTQNVLWIYILMYIPMIFTQGVTLMSAFVTSFITIVFTLVFQRMIVRMYIDICNPEAQ